MTDPKLYKSFEDYSTSYLKEHGEAPNRFTLASMRGMELTLYEGFDSEQEALEVMNERSLSVDFIRAFITDWQGTRHHFIEKKHPVVERVTIHNNKQWNPS